MNYAAILKIAEARQALIIAKSLDPELKKIPEFSEALKNLCYLWGKKVEKMYEEVKT